jgi:hypothetical protein
MCRGGKMIQGGYTQLLGLAQENARVSASL